MKKVESLDESIGKGDVFSRLHGSSTATSRRKQQQAMEKGGEDAPNIIPQTSSPVANLWNCDLVVEAAHTGPVYSIANMENLLFTSSTKSLKIWDIEKMECISDITAHNSFIKTITVLPN